MFEVSIFIGDSYLLSLTLFWSYIVLENIVSFETNNYLRLMLLIFTGLCFTIDLDTKKYFLKYMSNINKFCLKE